METRGNLDVLAEYKKNGANYTALIGVPVWEPNKQYLPGNMVKYLSSGFWKTFTAIISSNDSDPSILENSMVWEKQSKTIAEIRQAIGVNPTSPLGYNNFSGIIDIEVATSGTDGYITSEDWNYFNEKIDSSKINQPEGVPGISIDKKLQLLSASGTEISNLVNYNLLPREYTLPDRNLKIGSMMEWTPNTTYEIGARISYNDIFYKCIVPHLSSTLNFLTDYIAKRWVKISNSRNAVFFSLPNNTEYNFKTSPINIDVNIGRYDITLDNEEFYFFMKYNDFGLSTLEEDYLDIYIRNGIDLISQEKDKSNRLNIYVNKISETIFIQNLTGSNILEVNIKFTPKGI
jgi:hypothetical protein